MRVAHGKEVRVWDAALVIDIPLDAAEEVAATFRTAEPGAQAGQVEGLRNVERACLVVFVDGGIFEVD